MKQDACIQAFNKTDDSTVIYDAFKADVLIMEF